MPPSATEKYNTEINGAYNLRGRNSSISLAVATNLTPETKPIIVLPIIKTKIFGIYIRLFTIKPTIDILTIYSLLPY